MSQAIVTEYINELLKALAKAREYKTIEPEHPIHVSELTSLPAFAYEKLRNIVDYKEENLLRKNAIRRFLKRKFFLPQFTQTPAVAGELLRELILSRYVANDSIDEKLISPLDAVIDKYYALFNKVKHLGCKAPRWREQIIGLAAVECDYLIVQPAERIAFTALASKLLHRALDFSELQGSQEEHNVQLVLGIEKVLNRADRDILNYYLLLHYYPDWFKLDKEAAVNYLAPKIENLLSHFNHINNDRLGKRLMPAIKKLLVPVIIFRQIFNQYKGKMEDIIRYPDKLEKEIRSNYQTYWQDTKKRLRRKGFHAMAYIFVTKILLAILLELPYENFIIGHISYLPLAINLTFPPLLMMTITLMIKSPGPENEEVLVQGMKEMIYDSTNTFYSKRILKDKKTRYWAKIFYSLLYILTMSVSFGAITFILWRLGFNIVSAGLFIFFISLVSFFGINLRQQARQLKIASGRETITSFIIDFFSFPVIAFGRWLSNTFDRYNFFVFILDFMFEVPFKTILRIIEDWFNFLKEKKEEIL